MSESEKVEEKYKPFWHTEPEVKDVVDEPKVVTESKVEPPKESFFDNTIGEIFHRKNPKPKLPKNLKSKVKVKVESNSNVGFPFIRLVTGAITIGVVVGVGYMVLSQVMSVPAVQQEMNTTMIGGSSATLIMPAFAIVAVGIVVLAAFGLFRSGDA